VNELAKGYLKSIHERLGYFGSWLPNTHCSLGDIGILQDGVFERRSRLDNLSIGFDTRTGANPLSISLTSTSGVDIAVKARGETIEGINIPQASAGASLTFSEMGGFVFQAIDCYVDEMDDQVTLGSRLLAMHKNNPASWERDWCVVHTLVRAGSATIAISHSDGARLDLSAKASVAAGDLAKASGGLAVSNQSGDIFHVVAATGLTPLFKISRIRTGWLSGRRRFGGPTVSNSDAILEEVAPL
jgi:hypothetical protein